jgi:hypothetical protein
LEQRLEFIELLLDLAPGHPSIEGRILSFQDGLEAVLRGSAQNCFMSLLQ